MQSLSMAVFIIGVLGSCLWTRCTALHEMDFVFATDEYHTPRAALQTPNIEKVAGQIKDKFTLCLWIYIDGSKKQDDTVLVSYYSGDAGQDNEILLETHRISNYTALTIGGKAVVVDDVPSVDQWNHVCVSYNSDLTEVIFYFNAILIGSAYGPKAKIEGDGFLALGQDQDKKDGGYDYETGFNGRMTEFHMFDSVLNETDVVKVYKCELKGNVVDWSSAVWTLDHNVVVLPTTLTACDTHTPPVQPPCQKPTETSSRDLTSAITPTDGHNQVRSTLTSPKITTELEEFTVCFRLYYNENKRYVIFPFAYLEGGSQVIRFGFEARYMIVTVGETTVKRPNFIPMAKWSHVCITWSGTKNGENIIYLNGEEFGGRQKLSSGYVLPAEGDIHLIQDQVAPLQPEKPTEGFNLKLADVNLWKRALSQIEVKEVMECSNEVTGGRIINSKNAKYKLDD